jgi:hemolysin III
MKNDYPRSFLEIDKASINYLFDLEVLKAGALIIDYLAIIDIILDFEKYRERFDLFKEKLIQIYIKLDSLNLNKSYKEIKSIDASYLNGFALNHINKSILNKMTIKARDFEHSHKLNFGTMRFIAYLDNPSSILNYQKIASYDRVFALYLDKDAYMKNFEFSADLINSLREQIFLKNMFLDKLFIDSSMDDDDQLISDLTLGKKYGASAKLTNKLKQIDEINEFFIPTNKEIKEAKEFYDEYLSLSKKNKKNYNYKFFKSIIILNRTDAEMIVLDKQNNKLKPKKFYTFGEEIANAITHGVGILLALIFLVFLLIKGSGKGFYPNLAYIIYCLSALTLYLSSTLYHGLPLGSKAKYLFHKFDRMSIYLLIAGTYTPLTLISIGGSTGLTLFIILWVGSAIGIFLNFYKFGRFQLLHMFLYVFLGWIAIFNLKTIINSLGYIPSLLILIGGIAYTLGIIFYSTKLFKFTHMVWHLFTILGTILHFFAIYLA